MRSFVHLLFWFYATICAIVVVETMFSFQNFYRFCLKYNVVFRNGIEYETYSVRRYKNKHSNILYVWQNANDAREKKLAFYCYITVFSPFTINLYYYYCSKCKKEEEKGKRTHTHSLKNCIFHHYIIRQRLLHFLKIFICILFTNDSTNLTNSKREKAWRGFCVSGW